MKQAIMPALMTALLLLSGCAGGPGVEGRLEKNRDALADCPELRFQAEVTGGAGDREFTCVLDCVSAPGETSVTVASPESIAGIRATMADGETELHYDSVSLSLGTAVGDDAPLALIPVLAHGLRQGHILRAWREKDGDADWAAADIYVGEDRKLTVWYDYASLTPVHAALTVNGVRTVGCEIRNYETS